MYVSVECIKYLEEADEEARDEQHIEGSCEQEERKAEDAAENGGRDYSFGFEEREGCRPSD